MLLQAIFQGDEKSEFNTIIDKLAHSTLNKKHQMAESLISGLTTIDEITANKPYILHLAAKSAFDNGMNDIAQDFINKAIQLYPQYAEFHKTKGLMYFINNNHELAEKQFKTSLQLQPENNESWIYLADILLSADKYNDAYTTIKKLSSNNNKYDNYIDRIISKCLDNLAPDTNLPIEKLHIDLISYLDKANTSLSSIAEICFFTIKAITNKGNINFKNNQLLIKALTSGIITDTEIELALLQTRKSLLIDSLSQMAIQADDMAIISGLAIHSYYNEYIFYIDNEEKDLMEELKTLIQNISFDRKNIPSLSAFIMLFCMYSPISLLNINGYLRARLKLLPTALQYLIQYSLFNKKREQQIKEQLNSISSITDNISSRVQQQYEENPFPRWITVSYQMPQISYSQTISSNIRSPFIALIDDTSKLKILVAGCGTGQHPIALAKTIKNTHITAIDISKSSLAYAKRMAEEYQTDNIEFIHGDILDLAQLQQKFHIIECVGVLHHMKNPEAGLKILHKAIIDRGIIKLGLYSSLARKDIMKLRSINARIKMQPTTENLRHFRYAILKGNMPDQKIFTRASDFYSTSSCRDLLFHEQEHYFTIPQIQYMLDTHNLSFMGFCTSATIRDMYLKMFPSDHNMLNLDYWQVFETLHPDTFIGMYQFHCQAN